MKKALAFAGVFYFHKKIMSRPNLERVPPFYHNYISLVKDDALDVAFIKHQNEYPGILQGIPEEKWNHRYAEGKWTIKEVVQHVIDAERIFNYRALCFARKETASLPGFDENSYAAHSKANKRNGADLLTELNIVQQSSALLFKSFDEEQLETTGTANNSSIYVRAIGFITIGHALHHAKILKERYL